MLMVLLKRVVKRMSKLVKTNKEAIEVIKSNYPSSGYEMLKEALDMAIKALERCDEINE